MFTRPMPEILAYLRPGESFNITNDAFDYTKLDWLDVTAKPTEQELLDAELPMAKAARIKLIKHEAMVRIDAQWPDWKQINAALGLYDGTLTQTIKDDINEVRTDSDTAEAAVNALATVAEVQSFTW